MRSHLSEHVALLFHPTRLPDEDWDPPAGWERVQACSEQVGLYLAPRARRVLYGRRWRLPAARLEAPAGWRAADGPGAGRLLAGHFVALPGDERTGVLALAIELEGIQTEGQLRTALDVLRQCGPIYPAQWRPTLRLGRPGAEDGPAEAEGHLEDLLARLLGPHEPVFSDVRLPTWVYAAVDAPRIEPADLWALTALDPEGMPAPPERMLEAFMARRVYDRWLRTRTATGFCHVSAATVHALGPEEAPPSWLKGVFRDLYVEVGLWVWAVAARRRDLADGCGEHGRIPPLVALRHMSCWEREPVSDQDQGRQLARLWLEAIDAECRELEIIRLAAQAGD